MISRDDIDQIREKIDLVELIKDSDIVLHHSGRILKGLCPFPSHDEKTPSFTVDPESNRYICYGCGANGDAIDFIRECFGMTFVESLEFLAKRADIKIQHIEQAVATKKSDAPIAEINAAAREFFASQKNPQVTAFLEERNLEEDYMRREWGVGYSPARQLLPHLKQLGYKEAHIIEAGLANKSEKNNSVYEVFQNRMMWPIYDHLNRPAGFGARKIYENDPRPAKFVNTSATGLYKKNDVLFGLDHSRAGIRKDSIAILNEGYTDVVVFHLAGLPYSLATCGTAITENHIRRITRLVGEGGEIVVAMDGDKAGVEAATKIVSMASGYPVTLSCILFPEELDPEAYRREHGDQGLKVLFDNRKPLIEVLLTNIIGKYDLSRPESVSKATIETGKVLENVQNGILREQYERWLAGRLRTSSENISRSYSIREKKQKANNKNVGIEHDILRMAYQRPSIFLEHRDAICSKPEMFLEEPIKEAVAEILWFDENVDEAEWKENLLQEFPGMEKEMKSGLPINVIESDKIARVFMEELVGRLEEDHAQREQKEKIDEDFFSGSHSAADIMRRLATNGVTIDD